MFNIDDTINDQYQIRSRFIGGMGVVYIALDDVTRRTLAIKTLKDEFLFGDQQIAATAIARFEREARCWINLGLHDNIVHAISFHRADPPLLLLEFIEGQSLAGLLRSEPGGLDQHELVDMAAQICDGLLFAHRCPMPNGSVGVIHRDLKPANILVNRNRVLKLTDFGLVLSAYDTQLTLNAMGTLCYMAPEQTKNAHSVTDKADVYSMGIMIYEMLTGVRPFPSQIDPIVNYRPDADGGLIQIINSCLERRPENRPTTEELLNRLHELSLDAATDVGCTKCGYRARKEHLLCPVCGVNGQQANGGRWLCESGHLCESDYSFCLKCGAAKPGDSCGVCGQENPSDYHFCCGCGSKLAM